MESLGKPLAERRELRPHGGSGADRVGAGKLVDVHAHARLPVEPAELVILLRAKFDPGDVPQPHDHTGDVGRLGRGLLDDHVTEFSGGDQATDGRERDLERLMHRGGLLADAAGGHLEVLVFKRLSDVVGREGDRGHLFRVEPHPHAVVALPDKIDVTHSLHPQQFVADLDRRVVGEERRVVERCAGGILL